MANDPDRMYIAKEDKELYNKLGEESIGKGKTNKDLFLLAMATGCRNDVLRSFEARQEYVRAEYLNDRDLALLNAAAVGKTGSVEVVCNRSEVFAIAEEYAHAGIRILADVIDSSPHEGFEKRFEKELHDAYRAAGAEAQA